MQLTRKNLALAVIILLYISSLIFPAFTTEFYVAPGETVTGHTYSGIKALAYGWAGVLTLTFGWYANPFLFIAIFMYTKNNPHFSIYAALSLFIALSSFFPATLGSDKGAPEVITSFRFGFYLWLLAIALLNIIPESWLNPANKSSQPTPYRGG